MDKISVLIFCSVILKFASSRPTGIQGCSRPERIDHGTYILVGNQTTYKCDKGYVLLGEVSLECNGKQWSTKPPVCAAPGCPPLGLLEHGTIVYQHNMKTASFKCDDNYILDGFEHAICVESGWSNNLPICKLKSKPILSKHQQSLLESDYSCIKKKRALHPPSQPFAAESTEWNLMEGTPRLYTIYRCDWGYVPVGVPKKMYCKNGEWVGNGVQQCKYVGKVSHSENISVDELNEGKRNHEDWVQLSDYSCLSESSTVSPPTISNSNFQIKFAISNGMPHVFVKYTCNKGYTNVNEFEFLYCVNSKWYGQQPACSLN